MSNEKNEPRLTHSVIVVPMQRGADGEAITGQERNVGAVCIRDDGSGFRFVGRRSTDFDPGVEGKLILRALPRDKSDRERER